MMILVEVGGAIGPQNATGKIKSSERNRVNAMQCGMAGVHKIVVANTAGEFLAVC
jgi:hypothetical protein